MAFSDEDIQKVWEKGSVVPNYDANVWRKDQCGAWIFRSEHGNRSSVFGWEVDHITPQSNNGTDNLSNLRPLQWENNVRKQDGSLSCPITSSGNTNVRR